MRLLHLLIALCLVLLAAADTEIVNVRVPLPVDPDRPSQVDIIHLSPSVRHTDVVSHNRTRLCFALDLPDGGWTARISWPASTPTKFRLEAYAVRWEGVGKAEDGGEADGEKQLTVFDVRAAPLSPRIPYPGQVPDDEFETTFHILVEPLLFGVLPRTAVSAVVVLVVCVAGAVWVAPRAMEALLDVVQWVNEDERKDV